MSANECDPELQRRLLRALRQLLPGRQIKPQHRAVTRRRDRPARQPSGSGRACPALLRSRGLVMAPLEESTAAGRSALTQTQRLSSAKDSQFSVSILRLVQEQVWGSLSTCLSLSLSILSTPFPLPSLCWAGIPNLQLSPSYQRSRRKGNIESTTQPCAHTHRAAQSHLPSHPFLSPAHQSGELRQPCDPSPGAPAGVLKASSDIFDASAFYPQEYVCLCRRQ